MRLIDVWTTDQIDRAVVALQPGYGYLVIKDGVLPTYRGRVIKPPKRKTKRGRRSRKSALDT